MFRETFELDLHPAENPYTLIERALIADYLLTQGYLLSDLLNLPALQANSLMSGACRFAGLRLAEIESKALFCQKIHPPISRN